MKMYKHFTFLRNNKIQSIKLVRELYGLDLRSAKNLVDEICDDGSIAGDKLEIIIPSLVAHPEAVTNAVDPFKRELWQIEIRDKLDSYTQETVGYEGTVAEVEDECQWHALRHPGCPIILSKKVAIFKAGAVVKTTL